MTVELFYSHRVFQYSIIGRYCGINLRFLNDFIVIFLSTVKYLISKIKQLYFNPVLNLERGYACFRF